MADLQTLLSKFLIDLYSGTIGSGGAPITGIRVGNGSTSAPSYSFSSDTDTGFIWGGSGTVILVGNTTQPLQLSGTTTLAADNALYWTASNGNATAAPEVALGRDAANVLYIKNAANAQALRIYGTTTGPKYLSLSHDGTNGVIDTAASSGTLSLAPTNASSVTIGKAITSLAGITATGTLGVPVVVASANISAQSSNATITSYANPATDADFEVSGQMSVTASTTLTTTITCTYTDVASVARTMIMPIQPLSGTFTAAGAISGAGASIWHTPVMHIRAKASTTITLLTSAGTFTGVTYSASGLIRKLN